MVSTRQHRRGGRDPARSSASAARRCGLAGCWPIHAALLRRFGSGCAHRRPRRRVVHLLLAHVALSPPCTGGGRNQVRAEHRIRSGRCLSPRPPAVPPSAGVRCRLSPGGGWSGIACACMRPAAFDRYRGQTPRTDTEDRHLPGMPSRPSAFSTTDDLHVGPDTDPPPDRWCNARESGWRQDRFNSRGCISTPPLTTAGKHGAARR